MDAAKNFAKGTLSQGYDDTATSIALIAGDGARFPAAPFNAVWWNATDYPDPADDPNREIVRVTAITTDTLTVTRAQEGTSAITHNTEGKVYKLVAGLTAKVINSEMLNVTKTGNNYEIATAGNIDINFSGGGLRIQGPNSLLELDRTSGLVAIGDVEGGNSNVALLISDSLGQVGLRGLIGTDQSQSATTSVGTLTKKLQIFDLAGNSLGFIPIYSTIT